MSSVEDEKYYGRLFELIGNDARRSQTRCVHDIHVNLGWHCEKCFANKVYDMWKRLEMLEALHYKELLLAILGRDIIHTVMQYL